jgi:outer membrane immunogenic protein
LYQANTLLLQLRKRRKALGSAGVMRVAFLGALLACSALSGAIAADAYPPEPPPPGPPPVAVPAYNWTGVYIGGSAGFGSATATISTTGFFSSAQSEDLSGGVVGAHVGAQFQYGTGVFGIEADWQWTGQSKEIPAFFGTIIRDSIPSFYTVRARGGIALDRALIYVTAGGGSGEFKSAAAGGFPIASASTQRGLGAFGGGIEYAATQNLILGAEYLFFRSANISLSNNVTSYVSDNIVRARLSAKFGG